jgi:hypothetical protein
LMWLGLFFTMTLITTLILTGAGCWLNKQSVDFMYNKYVNVNGLEHFFPTAVKTKITTWIVGLTFFCFFQEKTCSNFSPADWKHFQPYDLNGRFLMTRFVSN